VRGFRLGQALTRLFSCTNKTVASTCLLPHCGMLRGMGNSLLFWWGASAVLVLLELLSGSFYLLMLALGTVVGALSAHAGVSPVVQVWLAACSSAACVFACYLWRSRKHHQRAMSDRSLHLDIGASVKVEHWENDGTAKVHYRGAQWTVSPCPGQQKEPGMYRVMEVVGSRLVVEKI